MINHRSCAQALALFSDEILWLLRAVEHWYDATPVIWTHKLGPTITITRLSPLCSSAATNYSVLVGLTLPEFIGPDYSLTSLRDFVSSLLC